MAEILRDLPKDKKKNLKDLPKDEVFDDTGLEVDVIKGDSSESGTNSYAKNNQKSIKALTKQQKKQMNKNSGFLK